VKRQRLKIVILLFSLFFFERTFAQILAAPVKDAHVEGELVSEVKSIQPGKEFWIALRLKMDKNWHTYWKNPGDSGLATTVKWELPSGWKAQPLKWPYPQKFKEAHLVTYGYEGEVFLLSKFWVPRSVRTGTSQRIKTRVEWLSCKEKCIPGRADLILELPVQEGTPKTDHRWEKSFAKARDLLPLKRSSWKVKAQLLGKILRIELWPPDGVDYSLTNLEFFPEDADLIDHVSIQSFRLIHGGYELIIPRSSLTSKSPRRMRGILVSKEGWRGLDSQRALEVNIPP